MLPACVIKTIHAGVTLRCLNRASKRVVCILPGATGTTSRRGQCGERAPAPGPTGTGALTPVAVEAAGTEAQQRVRQASGNMQTRLHETEAGSSATPAYAHGGIRVISQGRGTDPLVKQEPCFRMAEPRGDGPYHGPEPAATRVRATGARARGNATAAQMMGYKKPVCTEHSDGLELPSSRLSLR